jgi:Na+-transporting methylmalonyl-CoA/oxaloacetate decarboxylase gamma subunit
MIKRFFSFLFSLIASALIISSIIIFSALINFRNDDFVHDAFVKSDFSSRSKDIVLDTSEMYMRENVEVNDENQVPAKLGSLIIRTIIKNNAFEEVIDVVLKSISNLSASWFRGEDELVINLPKKEFISIYEKSGGDDVFIAQFIETAAFKDLPDCTSPTQLTEAGLLKGNLPCSGPFLVEFIDEYFQSAILVRGENYLDGFFNSVFPEFENEIVISRETEFLNTTVGNVQDKVSLVTNIAYIVVFFGLLLAGISAYLSKNRISAVYKITANIGIFLIIYSLISKVAIRILFDFYFWQKISFSPNVYTQEHISMILGLIKDFAGVIIDEILMTTIAIGGVFIFLTIIIYAISKLKRFRRVEDEIDEVEDEEENYDPESDLESQVFKSN